MNPISDFFRRYSGVPATDAGPTWSQAEEAVLLDWFNSMASVVRCGWNRQQEREATASERRGCVWVYNEIVAEVRKRANRPNASPAILAAYFRSQLPQK